MIKAKLISGLIILVFLAAPAYAQKLEDALAQMLAYNSALLGAYAQYNAQSVEQFIVLADMLPQVTAYAQESRANTSAKCYRTMGEEDLLTTCKDDATRIDQRTDTDGYGVEVTHKLFTSGKNLNAFRAKRAEIRAAQKNLVQTEQQIILQAITAYLDVLRTQSIFALTQKNEAVLAEQLVAVRDKFEVGVGTRTDIAQSQAHLANAKSGRLTAQSDLNAAKAIYLELFGTEPKNLQQPSNVPRLPRTLERAQKDARRDSPVLGSAQELVAMARFEAFSAIGSALPAITLTGTYANNEDPNGLVGVKSETTSLVARLTVPIFRGGKSYASVSASTIARQALLQNLHSASRAVDRDVTMAWYQYQSAEGAVVARQQQIEASQTALNGVRSENILGTRTTLDVLNAEQDLLDARVGLVEAQRNQQVTAYSLLLNIGHLTSKKLRIKPIESVEIAQTERVE